MYWAAPGTSNSNKFINERTIHWGNFFGMQQFVYKQLPDKLKELTYNFPKPSLFDALLGRQRLHRDFIYSAIKDNNIQDKCVMTYFGVAQKTKPHNQCFIEDFIWEPGTDVDLTKTIRGTHEEVVYNGIREGISRIIPIEIFNKTAYSIVAETNFDNRITFYTEKIAKPMMARRLFVVFTGYKFLEHLRQLGFQTFDNVIDESYDQIEDNEARWTAAFEQVKLLCDLDQAEVFDKIKDRVEHNYNLLMSTDWDQDLANSMQQKLNRFFNNVQSKI